jgi:hypothetical protein
MEPVRFSETGTQRENPEDQHLYRFYLLAYFP